MDSGAALRARAISASRSAIKYCSRGAMFGYCAFASAAGACDQAPITITTAKVPHPIVLNICRFIDSRFIDSRFIDFPPEMSTVLSLVMTRSEQYSHLTCEVQVSI